MNYNFTEFKRAGSSSLDWLKKEYAGLRANQATVNILDGIFVEVYGSQKPINQVASILIAGPKALLVTPWDKAAAPEIDRAIRESNLGVSVASDSQGVRISFPELTSERRTLLIKMIKEKLEEARIRVRTEREKVINDIDRLGKGGNLGEDDKFRLKNELQKLVEDFNNQLEVLASKKEKEIKE